MATDNASRASMDMRSMSSTGTAADSARRRSTVEESMRNVAGPGAVAHYAGENPAINTAMTPSNIDLVNDGDSGFRPAASIDEVVKYGDDRVARVSRAIKPESVGADGSARPGERFALTGVFHLPLDMCEPDGTTYHPLDDNGQPKDGRDGRPLVELTRLRAKDPDAMRRYFDDVLGYQTANVIPGGHDAVHAVAINVDESRPHMQILFDPFEADKRGKEPGALKSGYSRAFGRHPKDRIVEKIDKRTGKPKMAREGGDGKMTRYHAELKQHLLDRGWQIEAERDPVRHDRRESNADFQELSDQKRVIDNREVMVEEFGDQARDAASTVAAQHRTRAARLDAREGALDTRAAAVAEDREKLDAERAEWTAERPKLVTAAKAEGRAAGAAEAEQLVTDARTKAEQITTTASADAVRIRREADAEAEETKRAAKDRADQYYRDEKATIDEQLDELFTDKQSQLVEAITDYRTKLDGDRTAYRETLAEETRRVLEAPRPDGSPSIMERAEAQAAKNVDARYGGIGAPKPPASRAELLGETREQRLARQRRQRAAALGGVNEKIAKASEQSRDSGQSAGMEGM